MGQAGGVYRERASTLTGAVAWTSVADGRPTRVLPDGCIDLLWFHDRLVVAGPDTTASLSVAPAGSLVAGVRMAPGTAPNLLGVPAHVVRDDRVALADLWGDAAVQPLEDAVAPTAARAEDLTAALEAVLATRASRAPALDPLLSEVARRARRDETVGTIAREVGLSPRQLHRRALDAFGYGPKTLARILRLTRALDAARAGTALATVATEHGYSDQAHLARDVRALTGTTLGGLGLTRAA